MPSFDEELPMTLSWPSDTLPGLSTGVVNHVDKDSRPDLLKGINVKVEPGGGGHRWEESLKRRNSPGSGLCHCRRHVAVDQYTAEIVTATLLCICA